jgi:hypothetical protein
MRASFALFLCLLWIAAIPKIHADANSSKLSPQALCFVNREECYETCSYYEDDAKLAPCRQSCRQKYKCQALEHPNQIARSLED